MLKKYNQILTTLIYATDLLAIGAAWFFSYYLRFHSGIIPLYTDSPSLAVYSGFFLPVIIVWSVNFKIFDLYQPMRGRSSFIEVANIIKVSTTSILLMTAITFFYREHSYSRTVFLIFWVNSTVFLILTHTIVRFTLSALRKKGKNLRHVIIIGEGEVSQLLTEKIELHPEIGFNILGYITTKKERVGRNDNNKKIIGYIYDTLEIIRSEKPDQVFIALTMDKKKELDHVIHALKDETVDIKIVPDLLRYMKLNPSIDDFDWLPIVNISESPLYGWNMVYKRCLDFFLSLFFIIITFPLMALIAVLVKRSSKGPLIYKQERMGMDGKRFFIYKFRTMPVDAEKGTGPVWAKENDNRRTIAGKFLRQTSLDELPQFFNVLRGEMSLVGPRPERPVFVEEFKNSIPKYMLRHKIKAGITGWAQVNGFRGNTSITKRIEHDLHYIENWSIPFDLKIIILTLFKGLKNPNAY
ncbi:MAG: undecaprenyl-phosphate glucose phosphotransferase [Nitrospinota bacterium]